MCCKKYSNILHWKSCFVVIFLWWVKQGGKSTIQRFQSNLSKFIKGEEKVSKINNAYYTFPHSLEKVFFLNCVNRDLGYISGIINNKLRAFHYGYKWDSFFITVDSDWFIGPKSVLLAKYKEIGAINKYTYIRPCFYDNRVQIFL